MKSSRRFFLRRLFACALLGASLARADATEPAATIRDGWRPGPDDLHIAEIDGWTFQVSSRRARLVAIHPPGGANLLNPDGHRLWLGPQAEWPVFWPPPVEWTEHPAITVTLSPDARTLSLTLPRLDPTFPALTRSYVLHDDALELAATWDDDGRGRHFQALHILQFPAQTRVEARLIPGEHHPAGFAVLALNNRPGLGFPPSPPADVASRAGDRLVLAYSGREEKLGFAPQTLFARFPSGHALALERGTLAGLPSGHPEHGLLSQVYFGSEGWPMMEVEQFSPLLAAPSGGPPRVGFGVLLRPLR